MFLLRTSLYCCQIVIFLLSFTMIHQTSAYALVKTAQTGVTTSTSPLPQSSRPSGNNKGQWAISCTSAGGQTQLQCKMTQMLFLKKTRQRVLTVTISKPAKPGELATILFALPHGLHLPSGVQLKVDKAKKKQYPIQTSNAKGVYAATIVDNEMLTAFKNGNTLMVSLMAPNNKAINIPVTLMGFMAAYTRIMSLK